MAVSTVRPNSANSRTPDRILASALALFNSSGIASVSISSIAAEAGISPGNLHYHFRTKEHIVERIVKRYRTRILALTDDTPIAALDDIWLVMHLTLEAIEDFRFIYRDVDYLLQRTPRVAHMIRQITWQSVDTARRHCLALARAGVLRAQPDTLDGLALQMVFTVTCWGRFSGLLPAENAGSESSGRAAYQVLTLLDPYLSDDARLYMAYLRKKYTAAQG